VIVLLAMTAFLAGIMGLWVYLLPLLGAGGFAPDTAASAVSVGLAAQIAGGLLAALVGAHIGARTAWIAGIALAIGAIALMNGGGSAFLMLAGAGLFGFVWIFVPPFHMPAVLAVDPSGRGAMLVGTAQLSGTVIGPLVAAPVVTAQGVSAVWTLSAAWLALSLALLVAAQFHKTPEERIPS
jgi:MFS family permease